MKKNNGGRPKKATEKKRNKRVIVNFSPEEYERAANKAKRLNMPLSAFLRASSEGAKFYEADQTTPYTLSLLSTIANNINQIAKRLNQGRPVDDKILKVVKNARESINLIRDEILNQD